MLQMIMATLVAHNKQISNVTSNTQSSAATQVEKLQELCDWYHFGKVENKKTQKDGDHVGNSNFVCSKTL